MPGASITIKNVDTGIERKLDTNDAGNYVATFLQPGHYEVDVTKAGFAGVLRKDLVLQVGQTLALDLSMTVKSAQETVTVTGEAPVVDAEKTEVSQVVSQGAVNNLPVSGRRWDTFVLLTPNVTTDGTSGLVSYRGISGLYNSNTVDGANNNQALFSEARGRAISGAYVYSLDCIQEYQVTASNYSAELGQAAGGVVNAVTKSGANALHGDLFYYLRYPTWNALDPLPKSQGVYSQPIHQWQQFGASLGGPVIKDKLFYFVTYDGSRKVNPISYTSSTYTSSVRALTCPAQVTATQCANANAFLFGELGTFPRATNQDVGFGKVDYQINQRNHLGTSFDFMNYRAPNAYSTAPSYNNSLAQHQRKLRFPRAHFRGEPGFQHQQQHGEQPALPVGPRSGSGRLQRSRALHQHRQRDDLRRELRPAPHRGTGRAPHADCRHALQSLRPPHLQNRRGHQCHPRSDDQPV